MKKTAEERKAGRASDIRKSIFYLETRLVNSTRVFLESSQEQGESMTQKIKTESTWEDKVLQLCS